MTTPASARKIGRPRRRNHGEEGDSFLGSEERFPLLAQVAVAHGALLVGGVASPAIVDRCERALGLLLEWVPARSQNAVAQRTVIERIRRGRVGAVVLLEGLVGHAITKPLIRACKESGTPFAYGGRAGGEQLRAAFRDLEARLEALARDEGPPVR